jgi:lipopolysaccharide heptosyltransferase II
MRPIEPASVRRLLIRVNNWIGDVVMISPAVRALRTHYPAARIAILAKSWVLETLRGDPVYDELIEYDSGGAHRGLRGRLLLAADLRRRHFDLAVLFQKAFDAASLAFLGGARHRVGYATDHRSFLLTHALEPPPEDMHHVDVFLGIARALGCTIKDPFPSFHLRVDDRRRATLMLEEAGLAGQAPLVSLHPGASKEPRAWHAERFVELGRRLTTSYGGHVVLLGSRSERDLLLKIASGLPAGRVFVPEPGLSIKITGALMERCHLFVGNDSGPMHVAAALGVPTIGIFGPGTPRRTAPLSARGRVITVSRDYPCSPCRQNFFRECPPSPAGKPFCLEEIGVTEIEMAAAELLERPRAAFL